MGRKPEPPPTKGTLGDGRLITEAQALAEVCARIRSAGSFAFDTEFVMEDRFAAEVCVVQLATQDAVHIVDPFAIADLTPVWSLVADPDVEVIVHAGMEDLAMCQTQAGLTPQNVFDCQIACGMVTTLYPLSLARMVRHLLGVRLHKSQTLTDWRRRPLTAEQLLYAADDVVYLPAVRRELDRRLAKAGRKSWVVEEMGRFANPATYERSVAEAVQRLKGAGSLDGEGLAIARELMKTREELAAKYDRPARAVVRDHLLIEIAKHRWTDAAQIKGLRGLNLGGQAVRELAEAVARACASPKDQWPVPAPPDDETEQEAALAQLVGAVIRAYGVEHEIAHQLIATKKDIRAYVQRFVRPDATDAQPALEQGWRAESVGVLLGDVLRGRRRVVVRGSGRTANVFVE